mmetsp:Transcript_92097/g.260682  ORF Transcript_92097/g.260682 Transcript_92097/m.260682 type:complete len:368 (+) Transcript_92097:90-1193(+)
MLTPGALDSSLCAVCCVHSSKRCVGVFRHRLQHMIAALRPRHTDMRPRSTVTAWPSMSTRSPSSPVRSRTRRTPPRGEACSADMKLPGDLPNFAHQYGARMQCALPVTGSSSMPHLGAKKRLTKSKSALGAPARTRGGPPGPAGPGQVTTTPRSMGCTRARAPESGRSLAKASGDTSSSQSGVVAGPRPTKSRSCSPRPRAAASSALGAASALCGACAGKSMRIHSPSLEQRSTPASRVWNASGPGGARPVSQSAWAAPSVAWPQSATSRAGVNQRMSQAVPPSRGSRKAVSARLFSTATACIHPSSPPRCVKSTAAGLPASATGVKASTCTKSSLRRSTRSSPMSNHCSEPCSTAEGPRNSKPHCL